MPAVLVVEGYPKTVLLTGGPSLIAKHYASTVLVEWVKIMHSLASKSQFPACILRCLWPPVWGIFILTCENRLPHVCSMVHTQAMDDK